MKLVVLLSIATLVACDYSAPQPETPSDAYVAPEKVETVDETIEAGKPFFKFNNIYRGAFPPARFPPANFNTPSTFNYPSFTSFNYPYKNFNFPASRQGILPPISQIIPPQISQVVPPISQIVPPIFGNKPAFPNPAFPSPAVPTPVTPPASFFPPTTSLLNKFSFPYYSPLYNYPYAFPSTFSFPPSQFFPTQIQKQPSKAQPETLSTSYGPPVSGPVDPEPAGPAETSASFEQSPVSFPYEPAAPEASEAAAPHKPAQEYGLPSLN